MNTVYSKLVAYREDFGRYIIYVFEVIGEKSLFDRYIMCTRFPNWESPLLSIGDIGFLKYKDVQAGKDLWYDWKTQTTIPYKYTGCHFVDFVLDTEKQQDLIL